MAEECGCPIIDTLLQIEGFDGVIRSYTVQFNNIDHERIHNIEVQQGLMSSILERLTLSKHTKDVGFVIKVFEDVLGLDSMTDEFPDQFFVLLTRREFLRCIVYWSFTIGSSPRLQQLGVCVLTKILECCQKEENKLPYFVTSLLQEHSFATQVCSLMEINLKACLVDGAEILDESSNTIVVFLNFNVQLLRQITSLGRTDFAKELADGIFGVTMKCLRVLLSEEDVVQLCVEFLNSCLVINCDGCEEDGGDYSTAFFEDSTYKVLFDILSSYPYEGKVYLFVFIFLK